VLRVERHPESLRERPTPGHSPAKLRRRALRAAYCG
jgi:hypothetical protein